MSATEPPTVPFLCCRWGRGGGLHRTPETEIPTQLHSFPTSDAITPRPPSPLYAWHKFPLLGNQVLGVRGCFQWVTG